MKTLIILLAFILGSIYRHAQETEYLSIDIPRDEYILKAYLFLSNSSALSPTVLFLQGFPGTEGDELNLGKSFSAAGINLLSFNYSGIFKSGGKYGIENSLEDIQVVLDFLTKEENVIKYNIATNKIFLGGYSFGGGMALTYAANHPEITKVFSIAGTDHGKLAEELLNDSSYMQMMSDFFNNDLKYPNGQVRFVYENPFSELIDNRHKYYNKLLAKNLSDKNVLLIGGIDDKSVTLENHLLPLYRELKKNEGQNVTFKIYQTTHSFKNVTDELNRDVINWILNQDN